MRRDVEDILAAGRRHRFAIRLFTTGYFIDDARADYEAALSLARNAAKAATSSIWTNFFVGWA